MNETQTNIMIASLAVPKSILHARLCDDARLSRNPLPIAPEGMM